MFVYGFRNGAIEIGHTGTPVMSLSEVAIRAAKPRDRPYEVYDERRLYLGVKPGGGRLWRFKFVHGGVEKLLSWGRILTSPLRLARERRDEARYPISLCDCWSPRCPLRSSSRAQFS